MAKVAKLVSVVLITRVIVEDNASAAEIVSAAKAGFQAKIDNDELSENLEKIEDDVECPYGTFESDDNTYKPNPYIDYPHLYEKL